MEYFSWQILKKSKLVQIRFILRPGANFSEPYCKVTQRRKGPCSKYPTSDKYLKKRIPNVIKTVKFTPCYVTDYFQRRMSPRRNEIQKMGEKFNQARCLDM